MSEYLTTVEKAFREQDGHLKIEDHDIFEIGFRGNRKQFYHNTQKLPIKIGDYVIVEADSGYDMGMIYTAGIFVPIKMRLKDIESGSSEILQILRNATPEEIASVEEIKEREPEIARTCREKITAHGLEMKFVDVELRFDRQKISIFFTAEHRIDFRELVRGLASEFRVRIQMVQISTRDEARRTGGVGTCGRMLCCSSWLQDFQQVTTETAKFQNMQLNMSRLSGQCGRLKCCLNYELDTYMEQLKKFPAIDSMVRTERGKARIEKIDIFREELWLHYNDDDSWETMSLDKFKQLFVRK
ncbi:MAG: Signal peptidase-like protein [Chlorobiales bacterium]|nr:Signal peptidase-like protein [Chlorobiales bacterium]